MNYFGGPMQIGAGETTVVTSDALATMLGGGWGSGRGRCELVSNRGLAIQHMVRAHDILINNSVVVNKSVASHATYTCRLVDANNDGSITEADVHAGANRICTPASSGR